MIAHHTSYGLYIELSPEDVEVMQATPGSIYTYWSQNDQRDTGVYMRIAEPKQPEGTRPAWHTPAQLDSKHNSTV